jgi:hypothetical protein
MNGCEPPRVRAGSRARRRAASLAALALGACIGCPARPPLPPPEAPAPPVEPAAPTPTCGRVEDIEVRKSERTLVAECAGGGRLAFPIALSREPGAKRARGDRRTPEGQYRIAAAARPSRFHRFIPIDYPSLADAERALGEGRITRAERDRIARAHREGRLPPQDTPLGGHLGFHGEGLRWQGDLDLDWTEGCFALSDDAIELLGRLAPPGTPVRILP